MKKFLGILVMGLYGITINRLDQVEINQMVNSRTFW